MKRQSISRLSIAAAFLLFLTSAGNLLYASKDFNPIKFVRDSLPNGLQVIYHVDNSSPIVTTVVHYRVGSKDEPKGMSGYAHFFEHLMFEATDNIPRASIDKYVQEAGGNLNAYTSFDETVYHFRLPSNELRLALWIESQRMRRLHVDSVGVETQRGVVLEELKMRIENSPYGSWLLKMFNNVFPNSNYAWTPIGTSEDLIKAKISDFKSFYDNYYQPNNATLVIAGDINLDTAKYYVNEYFGQYPRGKEPKRPEFSIAQLSAPYSQTVIDEKAQLPALFIGFRGSKLGDDDTYALELLGQILGAGESSRFYQRIVDKDQTAIQAASGLYPLQHSGIFFINAVTKTGVNPKDVEKAIYEEIDNLLKNGITDEELKKVKNIGETQFVTSKMNLLGIATDLAQYYAYFGDPGMINNSLGKYEKINKEDIMRVAKKYLATENRIGLTYLPKQKESN